VKGTLPSVLQSYREYISVGLSAAIFGSRYFAVFAAAVQIKS
jgi:hypothetical protein